MVATSHLPLFMFLVSQQIRYGRVHQANPSSQRPPQRHVVFRRSLLLSSRLTQCFSIKNQWALLYLVKSISSDRKKVLRSSVPNVDTGLQLLSFPNQKKTLNSPIAGGSGVPLFTKDPDNIREIALREYAALVAQESNISESTLVRDIFFVSQQIDGRRVKFNEKLDSYEFLKSLREPCSSFNFSYIASCIRKYLFMTIEASGVFINKYNKSQKLHLLLAHQRQLTCELSLDENLQD